MPKTKGMVTGKGSSMQRSGKVDNINNVFKDDDSYAHFYNGLNYQVLFTFLNSLDLSRVKALKKIKFIPRLKVENTPSTCSKARLELHVNDTRVSTSSEDDFDMRKIDGLGWQDAVLSYKFNNNIVNSLKNGTFTFLFIGSSIGTMNIYLKYIKVEVEYSVGGDRQLLSNSNAVSNNTNLTINSDESSNVLPNINNTDTSTYDVITYKEPNVKSNLTLRSPSMSEFNIPDGATLVSLSLNAGVSYSRDKTLDGTNLVTDEMYVSFGNKKSTVINSSSLSSPEDTDHNEIFSLDNLNYKYNDYKDEAAEFVINYEYTDVATGEWYLYYLNWSVAYAVDELEYVSNILVDNNEISNIKIDNEDVSMYLGSNLILGEQ